VAESQIPLTRSQSPVSRPLKISLLSNRCVCAVASSQRRNSLEEMKDCMISTIVVP
jgi:hypothetical protein